MIYLISEMKVLNKPYKLELILFYILMKNVKIKIFF